MHLIIFVALLSMQFVAPNAASDPTQLASSPRHVFDIREYGAAARPGLVNTESIQNTIDACTESGGGGVVLVAGGCFVTGTIYLKDNVTLHVAEGAVLSGSTDINDYATNTHKNIYANEPHLDRCLVFARNAKHVSIEGKGAIDGQGHIKNFPTDGSHRPMLIRFLECAHLRMRDVNLINPASWTSAWLYCEDIVVDGVRIDSRVNWNGDGLDFDGCRDVRVRGCSFNTSDDSICLQASRADRPCKDIVVSDCIFVSKWAGMRIGLSSLGDFENIVVSNCIFRDISDAGLKIQMCEGGIMKNMVFSNLIMQRVPRPVFMTFNQFRMGVDTPEEVPPMRAMGSMQFSNIHVDNADLTGIPCGFVMSGVPGHYIEDLVFHNITLRLPGGGTTEDGAIEELPSFVEQRPEFSVLGERMPFAAFYARQVRRLKLSEISIETTSADARPAIVCDDADGVTIRNTDFVGPFTSLEKMRMTNVTNAAVQD
jgi:polygalacturonase